MAHRLYQRKAFFEVRVWGETTVDEIMDLVRELVRRDPRKDYPDLWVVSGESIVSFIDFRKIAASIATFVPPNITGNKSAIVAGDEFHRAQLEIWRAEASALPFEIRIFVSRKKAIKWLTSPETSTAAASAM